MKETLPAWFFPVVVPLVSLHGVGFIAWAVRMDRASQAQRREIEELTSDVVQLKVKETNNSDRIIAIETDVKWIRRFMEQKS